MQRIVIEKQTVDSVPLLTVCEEGARNHPLVFIIHGFTGDKTAEMALAYLLADAGFFAVLPDACLHGDRPGERLERSFQPEHAVYPPGTGLDPYFLLHEIVEHTAADVSTLIDHFAGEPRVDAGHPRNLKLSVYGGAAHRVTSSMRCEVRDWMVRHLQPGA